MVGGGEGDECRLRMQRAVRLKKTNRPVGGVGGGAALIS